MPYGVMAAAATKISQEETVSRRNYGRALLSVPSSIMLPSGNFACNLNDLSLVGARISTDHELEWGHSLWLKLDKLKVFGIVVWANGGEYGIQFEEHLPKTLVLRMQGYSVDPEEYEAMEAMLAARDWAVGAGATPKSLRMKLLGFAAPQNQDDSVPCDRDEVGFNQALRRQFRKYGRTRRLRTAMYLALAAIIGTLLGIGSELVG